MHATELLGCLVGIIAAAVAFYYLFNRMDAGLVGLIVCGVFVGIFASYARPFEHAGTLLDRVAEFGVMALLFAVGLDFSLRRLQRLWRFALVGGLVQMLVTIVLLLPLLLIIGLSWRASIFTAILASMSSTVICMQILHKLRKVESPEGGIAIGVLLFQDLSLLPLMLLLPFLSGGGAQHSTSFGQVALGALALIAVFIAGFYGFNPLFDAIARQRDRHLMRMTLLLVCFGSALATGVTGMSPALGSFVAGLTLSRTRYSYDARGAIEEYISTFGMVFFIAVGRILDLSFVLQHLPLIALCLLVLILVKIISGIACVLALRYPIRVAVVVGLLLAQIGELAFVASQLGLRVGALNAQECQILTAVAVLSMALTPFVSKLGFRLAARIDRRQQGADLNAARSESVPEGVPHAIIIGAGMAGHIIERGFELANGQEGTRVTYSIVEMNPVTVAALEKRGVPVVYGQCTRLDVLERAGLSKAKVICFSMIDDEPLERAIPLIRRHNKDAVIITRVRFSADTAKLRRLGANIVVAGDVAVGYIISRQANEQLNLPVMPVSDTEKLAEKLVQTLNLMAQSSP